jgi:hypothetical protein
MERRQHRRTWSAILFALPWPIGVYVLVGSTLVVVNERLLDRHVFDASDIAGASAVAALLGAAWWAQRHDRGAPPSAWVRTVGAPPGLTTDVAALRCLALRDGQVLAWGEVNSVVTLDLLLPGEVIAVLRYRNASLTVSDVDDDDDQHEVLDSQVRTAGDTGEHRIYLWPCGELRVNFQGVQVTRGADALTDP